MRIALEEARHEGASRMRPKVASASTRSGPLRASMSLAASRLHIVGGMQQGAAGGQQPLPAGVSLSRRVVRVISFTPSSCSSSAIARLTAAFGTPRARAAAAEKPFRSMTLAKVAMWAGKDQKLPSTGETPDLFIGLIVS
jgi:hypothetical protein